MTACYGRVYLITNLVNGKVYVGQTTYSIQRRWGGHKTEAKSNPQSPQPLHRAILKYGFDLFWIRELERCGDMAALNAGESKWVRVFDATNPQFGYNCTSGGDRWHTYSPEAKARISKSVQRKWLEDPSYRERVSRAVTKQWSLPDWKRARSDDTRQYFVEHPELRQHLSAVAQKYMIDHPRARNTLSVHNKTPEARAAKSESRKRYHEAKRGTPWATEEVIRLLIQGLKIVDYDGQRKERRDLPPISSFQGIYGKTFKEIRDGKRRTRKSAQ